MLDNPHAERNVRDRHADRDVVSGARSSSYQVEVTKFAGVASGSEHGALEELHVRDRLDAARERLESSRSRAPDRLHRQSRARRRPCVLRPGDRNRSGVGLLSPPIRSDETTCLSPARPHSPGQGLRPAGLARRRATGSHGLRRLPRADSRRGASQNAALPLEAACQATSYFVLVRETQIPEPRRLCIRKDSGLRSRTGFGPRTYPDETNEYFWAVLPSTELNGQGVTASGPRSSAPRTSKSSRYPPSGWRRRTAPSSAFPRRSDGAPRPMRAVTAYRSHRTRRSRTSSLRTWLRTRHRSRPGTYPADVNLYWRVRADAETIESTEGIGLTWSTTGTFIQTLPAPVPDPGNPTSGDSLPTWQWAHVPGSISYDMQVVRPTGGVPLQFFGLPSRAFTPTLMKGTGNWQWRVRANFPQTEIGVPTDGPWTPWFSFTRTIREPGNASEDTGSRHVALTWNPKAGARNYRVQISTRPDFTTIIDTQATDNPSFAPLLTHLAYAAGGTFYWHVAAADDVFSMSATSARCELHTGAGAGDSARPRPRRRRRQARRSPSGCGS